MAVEKPLLSREETAGLPAAEWRSIHWIKPSLICEVAFTEWTQDNRIRHPSFQGLREDKDAGDVKQETATHTAKSSGSAPAGKKAGTLVVSGVAITHADRIISDAGRITKGELAEYYAGVAAFILPQVVRRAPQPAALPLRVRRRVLFSTQSRQGTRPRREDVRLHPQGRKAQISVYRG